MRSASFKLSSCWPKSGWLVSRIHEFEGQKLLGESVAFHCWLFARRLEAHTQPGRLFGDHLWTGGRTQAVCRKPSCFLLISGAARWRMEFQLFPFRTGVCGRRQKSSLAEPQRQLARPSAYSCRKGRLVPTAQGPAPSLSLYQSHQPAELRPCCRMFQLGR